MVPPAKVSAWQSREGATLAIPMLGLLWVSSKVIITPAASASAAQCYIEIM